MPARTLDPHLLAKLVELRSIQLERIVTDLRALQDELPRVWAGIAEDALSPTELWATQRRLHHAAEQLSLLARRRRVGHGSPQP